MFINLYMFRATICPSSGETTVFILCEIWYLLFCVDDWCEYQSSTQNNKYQVHLWMVVWYAYQTTIDTENYTCG